MEAFETFEVDGMTVELHYDEDGGEYADPRDHEGNVGVMVCWHPDYALGDEQIRNADGRGAIGGGNRRMDGSTSAETAHEHSGRFSSIGMLARWASLVKRSPVVLPLYLFDHSGITMTAGAGLVVGETRSGGVDEFGSPRGWDTTLCGVIYTTPERWAELMGQDVSLEDPDAIRTVLRGEVEQYAAYLEGRVYGYVVKDAAGVEVDSCWGFLADTSEPGDGCDYVRQEAREAAEAHVEGVRAKRCQVARAWSSLWLSRGFGAVA